MKAEDIVEEKLTASTGGSDVVCMLPGEIPGAAVYLHRLAAGQSRRFPADWAFARILFLCSGEAEFSGSGGKFRYDEKAVYVHHPGEPVEAAAFKETRILEIRRELGDGDRKTLEEARVNFPVTARYSDALQYRDPFKSEKTISRAILPQRIIPRFAMGSVETYGDDLIGQHEHPLLDQFFFSFPENDMDLLLDDIVYPMKGDTLLHIPLGCNHGVSVKGKQCAHYIWIDYVFGEEGIAFLDKTHKKTGTKRSF
jgi:hypothetical protein